jgi:hypothetical protein
MIAWLAACAMRRIDHYEPVSFHLDPPDPVFAAYLPDELSASVGRRWLRAVSAPVPVDELPLEVQYAIYATSKAWTKSAELDLRVDLGRGPYAVQLRWTRHREVEVAWSDLIPTRAVLPPGLTLADWEAHLAERYGFAGFAGPVAWSEDEVADLAFALGSLSEAERAPLEGVSFLRDHVSPRSARRELAYFDPTTDPPSLSFFDLAFDSEPDAFAGPPSDPVAVGVTTALHEFGHLLADLPLRRAYDDYLDLWEAWQKEPDPTQSARLRAAAKARYRQYLHLGRSGPVVEAWDAFRAGRLGPSSYGFRERNESFAEAYALYHTDPDALERALPGAVAWFASGAHLTPAGLSADAPAPE